MKIIKIFIASSIVEFEREREQIENFIRNVSDDFEERHNIKFKPILCGNADNAMAKGRKQEEYNEDIRNSEMIFFIFFTKIGEFTREEFNVAFSHFREFDKPKIYTYFKELSDGETMEKSLADFMDTLDNALSHYHSMFSHIDTIKLRILLNIKLNALDFVEIKAEDGYCVVDGKKYLSLDNLPEFFNNGILNDLKKELEETEKKYYELKPHYVMNDDEEKRNEYIDVAAKRQRLIDEIDELEKNIFKLSLNISESASDFDISPRLAEAYRLLEAGEYERALIVLDTKEIEDECERELAKIEAEEKMLREKKLKVIRRYIKENKARIDILVTTRNYPNRFEEIDCLYRKITAAAEEYEIDLDVLLHYTAFLLGQKKHKSAVIYAEKLYKLWEDDENCNPESKIVLYNMLGVIYYEMNSFSKAEEFYLKSLEICNKIKNEKTDGISFEMLQTGINLAVLYKVTDKNDEAEKLYLEILQYYKNFSGKRTDEFLWLFSSIYNNLANFYKKNNKIEEAEKLYLEALKIRKELAEKKPDIYQSYYAKTCNNLGAFYKKTYKKESAEKFFNESLKIFEEHSSINPSAFLPDVAQLCNNLANLYKGTEKNGDAEELYLKALKIRKDLMESNPETFSPHYAQTCRNFADYYSKTEKKDEAEKLYLETLKIYNHLADNVSDAFLPEVAEICNSLAIFYMTLKKDDAEKLFQKSLKIYRTLAETNYDAYQPKIAMVCGNFAIFYNKKNNVKKAEELYLDALRIYGEVTKNSDNPDCFLPDIALTCNNLAYFYEKNNRKDRAEPLFSRTLEIAKKYADNDPTFKQIVEKISRRGLS